MSGSDSPTTSSATDAAVQLTVLFSRLRRQLREAAPNQDLTPSQTSVLSRLNDEGPSSASGLAAVERVRPQSMATTLAGLDDLRLIKRTPDPSDGRRQLVTLTTSGRNRLVSRRPTKRDWLVRELTEQYSESERQTILEAIELLHRLSV